VLRRLVRWQHPERGLLLLFFFPGPIPDDRRKTTRHDCSNRPMGAPRGVLANRGNGLDAGPTSRSPWQVNISSLEFRSDPFFSRAFRGALKNGPAWIPR